MSDAIAKILPQAARMALLAAAGVDPSAPRAMSPERSRALDHAIREVMARYPTYFQQHQRKDD